ncbi:MAG: VWA domain-containing protein [Gemmataceae bacterium]
MPFWFLNAALLFGLAAASIPLIIHLLTRKRYDVVDWAAMQFLQISERTRRKIFLEELILMLLRMGLIALFVLALAAPFITSQHLAKWGGRGNRDVVIIFDGSYSMGFVGKGPSAHQAAKDWAQEFVGELAPGDSVAVLQAKQQVVPVLANLTTDPNQVRTAIQNLPPPRGGVDWPAAVQAAAQILNASQRAQREIIVLTDGQRFGWADDSSLLRWELLSNKLAEAGTFKPRVWVVNMEPKRPENPPNWSVNPLRTTRAVAAVGREVVFRTSLQLTGAEEIPMPAHIYLEVDGRPAGELPVPGGVLDKGQVPLSFKHRFPTPGSHLVSVRLSDDALPGDNRQDFAVEVLPALPVLLVDGDERTSPKIRGTDFLRDALAPARDPNPSVLARVMPITSFEPSQLTRDLGDEPGTAPRVLILHNVARLTPAQQEGVDRFLADGGGLLVTLGERAEAKAYNDQLFRAGQGWLPAALVEPIGAEDEPQKAARPVAASFFHPAVDIFRETSFGGLADARFPKRWKVSLAGATMSTAIAMLTGSEPLFVERPYRSGRVILSTVPLDNSWRTNLTDMPAFVPLAHELVYYLAGARSSEINLAPGQPIRYRPADESASGVLVVQPPDGEPKAVQAKQWPFVYDDTREPGVYTLTTAAGRTHYYAVQSDARESNLALCTDEDRNKVAALVPNMTYTAEVEDVSEALTRGTATRELWLVAVGLVFPMLFGEVWMTRRMALARMS